MAPESLNPPTPAEPAQALIVQKYGGTSVGSPERIRAVARRISRSYVDGTSLVVVVSAMGHTTDELIALAHQVSAEPPHREMDMLLTAGERISMALLSMALADLGIPALSLTGSQSGIITDHSHRRARIRRILGDRIRTALGERKVVIVAGFQGVSEKKEITTLGRGGSDTTAVALAATLGAEVCEIYTDVDGVYSADPRVVPGALRRERIPHDLMVELATRGAGVLHPRSVELAEQAGVRLCVKTSMEEGEMAERAVTKGTIVEKGLEEYTVAGVTADAEKMLLTVDLCRPTVLGAVMDTAAESHLAVIAPIFSSSRVEFFVERDAEKEWKKHLERLVVEGFVASFELRRELVPLTVVGRRFAQDGKAIQQVIEILARNNISVTMGSASSLAITVAVPATHADDGIRALHDELIPGKKTK
ncbi:MAG TPA: aspartate kinase [Bdellovibrionota bacterium]|nr:aspartate kinase [Bdellovibrionota bacterium]